MISQQQIPKKEKTHTITSPPIKTRLTGAGNHRSLMSTVPSTYECLLSPILGLFIDSIIGLVSENTTVSSYRKTTE